jgi:hypothetical protein
MMSHKRTKGQKRDIHPRWNDTPRRNGPRFRDIIVGWNESVTGDFEKKPYYTVDKYVRDDAGDYAICDTVGRNLEVVARRTTGMDVLICQWNDEDSQKCRNSITNVVPINLRNTSRKTSAGQ